MQMSMHQACVPVFARALNNLAAVLEKAAAHATERKIDQSVLLGTRLFPDMFPLVRQVQLAADSAKGGAARLANVEMPVHEDVEKSFAELIVRLRKTVEFLESLQPAQFEGSEDRAITWQTRSSSRSMQGLPYLQAHAQPNVYFHVTTAYAILRHCGVVLGKKDYLGQ